MRNIVFILIFILISLSCKRDVSVVEANSVELSIDKNMLYYKGKEYSGILLVRFDTNELKEKRNYKNGLLHGNQTKWYPEGQKYSLRNYNQGIKTGVHLGWWKNGITKFEFHFNNKGEHDGISNEWFENGTPFKLFHYKKGKEEGSQKMFKPNGNLRSNYVVVQGDRFGLIGLKKCDAVSTM